MTADDFTAFAERCQQLSAAAEVRLVNPNPFLVNAERHARLLAQIETWANEANPPPKFTKQAREAQAYISGLYESKQRAKAHIKALLEQP